MRRREALRGGVVALAALGGCTLGPETQDTTTESTSPTSETDTTTTATTGATSTTERPLYHPTVVDAHLVSTWAGPGDLAENRIETVAVGSPAVVAFRYAVRLPEGHFRFREEVEVRGPDGSRLGRKRVEVGHTTDAAGTYAWEHALAFDTTGWPTGECTAVVTVGNLELHRVSESHETTFRVVD